MYREIIVRQKNTFILVRYVLPICWEKKIKLDMLKQMVWFVRHLFQYLSLLIAISCHLTHDKEQTAITFPSYILFRDDGSNQLTKLQDISNSLQNIYNPEVIF